MTPTLIINIYNRPEYLKQCLESVSKCDMPERLVIILVNDGSTDPETNRLFNEFSIPNGCVTKVPLDRNYGIRKALQKGCEFAFYLLVRDAVVINLDSDTVVKPNFITRIMELHTQFPDCIVTGFNSRTKNADGSDRHPLLHEYDGYNTKKSVGGVNMCFNKEVYEKYIEPALKIEGNWDYHACLNSMAHDHPIVCAVPSVVQHIGWKSTMGHDGMDMAEDFKQLTLSNVTLIGIDCLDINRLIRAADLSEKDIQFGATKLLTSIPCNDSRCIQIEPIRTKEQYSQFVMNKLCDYVDTSYMLIFQHDGFVLNWQAWDNEFLNYDYIGATWWFKDGKNVGNGGFSLRSKALMQTLSNNVVQVHPEDEVICRIMRADIERHGFRFAPAEIADKFSIEAYNCPDNKYRGQFGFHGANVDFSGSNIGYDPLLRPAQPIRHTVQSNRPLNNYRSQRAFR